MGKVWIFKNLVMNVVCRSRGFDREGKIYVYILVIIYFRVRMFGFVFSYFRFFLV